MQHKIIYTADVHGNIIQYKKLVDYALKTNADSVIIGGDILPKGLPAEQFLSGQKKFIEDFLPGLLSPLKGKIPVYLMMGNDDCAAHMPTLEKCGADIYQVIHNKRLPLTKDFDLVGYSCVSITPFPIKDWEKHDFSNVPGELFEEYRKRKKDNYNIRGIKSTESGWENFEFTSRNELSDSIQKDLGKELFTEKPSKTVYVMHCPPDNTNLDLTMRANSQKEHIGSLAIKRFIEQNQPFLTLHGHFHETVCLSGTFKDKIKETICMSPGNDDKGEDLALLVIDLYDLNSAKRVIF